MMKTADEFWPIIWFKQLNLTSKAAIITLFIATLVYLQIWNNLICGFGLMIIGVAIIMPLAIMFYSIIACIVRSKTQTIDMMKVRWGRLKSQGIIKVEEKLQLVDGEENILVPMTTCFIDGDFSTRSGTIARWMTPWAPVILDVELFNGFAMREVIVTNKRISIGVCWNDLRPVETFGMFDLWFSTAVMGEQGSDFLSRMTGSQSTIKSMKLEIDDSGPYLKIQSERILGTLNLRLHHPQAEKIFKRWQTQNSP